MQNPDMITFRCPSCSMMLQVPAQMAGVTGPCPECSANITAPFSNTAANPELNVAPSPAAHPSDHPNPNSAPSSPTPQPAQQTQRPAPQQPQTQEHPKEGAQDQGMVVPNPLSQQATPAPLKKPTRSQPSVISREGLHQSSQQPKDKPRPQWIRIVFPLTFLIVAALLILVVLQTVGIFNVWSFKNEQGGLISNAPTAPTAPTAPAEIIKPTELSSGDNGGDQEITPPEPTITPPKDNTPTPSHQANPDITPPTPVIKSNMHAEGEFPVLQLPEDTSTGNHPPPPVTSPTVTPVTPVTPATPKNQSPPKAGFLANQVLNQFLAAKTLDERIPLMSKSLHTREELMSSSLAAQLKTTKSVRLLEMVPRAEDNMTQYLYSVSFEDESEDRQRHRIVMQVVERPGTHSPKVHADAFIDHYEKKFSAYAKTPNKKTVTFHCIAEARTASLAKELPVELKDSMIRLVIKSHPLAAPAFDAYLNKNSPLMKDIGPRKDFPYTEARFCVLSFRWNTTHPSKPYIELNDIVRQGWER